MGGNVARRNPENTGEPDGGNPCVGRGETGSRGAGSLQSPQSILEPGELAIVPPLRGLAWGVSDKNAP